MKSIDFSGYQLGKLHPEFDGSLQTGSAAPGDWQVIDDPTASQGQGDRSAQR